MINERRGFTHGLPSLPKTTPLGSFLGWVSSPVEAATVGAATGSFSRASSAMADRLELLRLVFNIDAGQACVYISTLRHKKKQSAVSGFDSREIASCKDCLSALCALRRLEVRGQKVY